MHSQDRCRCDEDISFFDQHLTPLMFPAQRRTEDEWLDHPVPSTDHTQSMHGPRSSWTLGLAYGQVISRLRWVIIALWIIVVVGSIPLAFSLAHALGQSGDTLGGSQSQKADRLLTSRLHQPVTRVLAIVHSSGTPVSDSASQSEVHDILARARSLAHVTSVVQAGISNDGRSDLIVVDFDQDADTVAQELPALRTQLSARPAGPAHVDLTADGAMTNETLQPSPILVEILVVLLMVFALLMVLGGIVACLLSLILAGMAVVVALALLSLLALHLQMSTLAGSVVSFLGLGLSVDFSLVMIRRFREELEEDVAIPLATARAIATAGEAMFWSFLIVIISFGALLFAGTQIMTSFGIGGIMIASTTMLATMTLLPAMLSVVGTHIRLRSAGQQTSTLWRCWARLMMKQPILIMILVTLLLIGLAGPALSLTLEHADASARSAGSQIRWGLDVLITTQPNRAAGSRDDEVSIDHLHSLAPQGKQGLPALGAGTRTIRLDMKSIWSRNMLCALVLLLLSTFFVLFLLFRSLLLAFQAIVMNICSISGASGMLVLVLQQGHGGQVLAGSSSGFADHLIPLVLFCTLFGLSMDDKVFLLSRIRQAWLGTQDHRRAVIVGLEKTDGGIANLALLVAMGLGTCLFTHVMVIQQWGLGLLMAALMEATVTRLVLIPVTMELMGRWSRWVSSTSSTYGSLLVDQKRERHLPILLSWLLSGYRGSAHIKGPVCAQQRVVEQTLIQIVAQVLERSCEQVQATSDFFEEGGDSRSLVTLLGAIEQRWQVPFEANDVFDYPVLFHLASLITQRYQQIHVRASLSHSSGEGLLHENRPKKRSGDRSCLTLSRLSLR